MATASSQDANVNPSQVAAGVEDVANADSGASVTDEVVLNGVAGWAGGSATVAPRVEASEAAVDGVEALTMNCADRGSSAGVEAAVVTLCCYR